MREKTRLEERKRELEQTEQVKPETEQVAVQVTEQVEEPVKIYNRKFWVKGTADQLRALGQYMKNNGIEYGGIE